MLNIYSPSGKEEEIVAFCARYLQDHNLPVETEQVQDERRNINIFPRGSGPVDVAFIGHLDTVPAFDIEHIGFQEKGGMIYGLGAADMKGGCAALIEAFTAFTEARSIPQHVGLFLVVGEEESGDGIKILLKHYTVNKAILAEPTNMLPCHIHYGYLEVKISIFGMRRHASIAGRDSNAIYHMLELLLRVSAYLTTSFPQAILNIRDLHSSEAGFAVPSRCEAGLDLHIPPQIEPEYFIAGLKNLVGSFVGEHNVPKYQLKFPTVAAGYTLDKKDILESELKMACARKNLSFRSFKSHSDANPLFEAGCKPLILGPGRLANAHTVEEYVDFEQVFEAAEVYYKLLHQL